ncbi:MAG: 2-oxoacid:acceptor oxidoreductase family protein [Huintestinicola sp.]
MKDYFDLYIVGVGGQGVLTIADIITLTATRMGIDINYYPTKGMAQRGGFVKAQLRIGRAPNSFSPSISPRSADLVVSMELCETLRAIRYAKQGAEYVVLDEKWLPTEVMLGNGDYPSKESVQEEIKKGGGKYYYINSGDVPDYARPNLFVLGVIFANTQLKNMFSVEEIEKTIAERWPKVAENNLKTFRAGLECSVEK